MMNDPKSTPARRLGRVQPAMVGRVSFLVNYLLVLVSFTTAIERSYSQSASKGTQAIEMLREFYIAQSKINLTIQDIGKKDSLQKKYCSRKLQEKLKEQFNLTGLDHDLLTKDYGIDSLGLKTLKITKDPKQRNCYDISYSIYDDVIPNITKKEIKVEIKVAVKKENHILKVDNIN